MRAKTLVELLTLSTNLYMIAKDEEFMENLSEMMKKGKRKVNDLMEDISGSEGEQQLAEKLLQKAKQAKEEFEKKMEEVARVVYAKMQIAHAEEVERLAGELERVKRELALAEARILHLEQSRKDVFGK